MPIFALLDYHAAILLPASVCLRYLSWKKGFPVQSTVQQLATLVRGKVHGDCLRPIVAARPVSEARSGDITFVESERYARMVHACQASAVVFPAVLGVEFPDLLANVPNHLSLIEVPEALSAFIAIAQHLRGEEIAQPPGIDPRAVIDPSVLVGDQPSIGPLAVVGHGTTLGARCRLFPGAVVGRNCRLGDDVTLHPHVVLYDGVVLGNRVTIHANAVIGADGFGYRQQEGRNVKIPQLGHVEIGDDVEIGACATIDRGTFQPTRIGEGTKIDNLVQIAHNCKIGKHNIMASQVGIAGSCTTGDHVVMAGQAALADHVDLGAGVIILAQSGVHRSVPPGLRMFGSPARPDAESRRILVSLEHLPDMRRDLRLIKQRLGMDSPEKAAG